MAYQNRIHHLQTSLQRGAKRAGEFAPEHALFFGWARSWLGGSARRIRVAIETLAAAHNRISQVKRRTVVLLNRSSDALDVKRLGAFS